MANPTGINQYTRTGPIKVHTTSARRVKLNAQARHQTARRVVAGMRQKRLGPSPAEYFGVTPQQYRQGTSHMQSRPWR